MAKGMNLCGSVERVAPVLVRQFGFLWLAGTLREYGRPTKYITVRHKKGLIKLDPGQSLGGNDTWKLPICQDLTLQTLIVISNSTASTPLCYALIIQMACC